MMMTKQIRNGMTIALVAMGLLGLTVGSAGAASITILNPGFEDASGPAGNNNMTVVGDWTEENAGGVYIDGINPSTSWKPEPDRSLYLSANTAVNQDLAATWSATDVFTLGVIGQNAGWVSGTTEFRVQLRQTDATVLWDSGAVDVTGTVINNNQYAGTNHIHSWTIDASTFSGGGVVENSQLNIRIAHVSGTPYMDDVTLETSGVVPPSEGGDTFADTITLVSTGTVGLLQWQQSANGSSWNDVGGATSSELDITALYTSTPWFRVEATSGTNAPAYTEPKQVTLENVSGGKVVRIN